VVLGRNAIEEIVERYLHYPDELSLGYQSLGQKKPYSVCESGK
jgi:hypothetical protein